VTLRRGAPELAGRFFLASYPIGIGLRIRSCPTLRGATTWLMRIGWKRLCLLKPE
jgi:hypothetical protein